MYNRLKILIIAATTCDTERICINSSQSVLTKVSSNRLLINICDILFLGLSSDEWSYNLCAPPAG